MRTSSKLVANVRSKNRIFKDPDCKGLKAFCDMLVFPSPGLKAFFDMDYLGTRNSMRNNKILIQLSSLRDGQNWEL